MERRERENGEMEKEKITTCRRRRLSPVVRARLGVRLREQRSQPAGRCEKKRRIYCYYCCCCRCCCKNEKSSRQNAYVCVTTRRRLVVRRNIRTQRFSTIIFRFFRIRSVMKSSTSVARRL